MGELFGLWHMPPRKRKVHEPLAVSFEAPIGGVVAVRGGGVYDEAKKCSRFNAQLFDQDDAPVYVYRARFTINIPKSDASDAGRPTSSPHHHGPVLTTFPFDCA